MWGKKSPFFYRTKLKCFSHSDFSVFFVFLFEVRCSKQNCSFAPKSRENLQTLSFFFFFFFSFFCFFCFLFLKKKCSDEIEIRREMFFVFFGAVFAIVAVLLFRFVLAWEKRNHYPLVRLELNSQTNSRESVLVVGAGAAGMSCAFSLMNSGKFRVFVADDAAQCGGVATSESDGETLFNDGVQVRDKQKTKTPKRAARTFSLTRFDFT